MCLLLLLLLLLLHKVPIPNRKQIRARQKLERHTVASLHDDEITGNDLSGVPLSLCVLFFCLSLF